VYQPHLTQVYFWVTIVAHIRGKCNIFATLFRAQVIVPVHRYDLNRHWVDPDQWKQPEILATKEMLLRVCIHVSLFSRFDSLCLSIQFRQNSDIDMDFVIDIHAHSVATNGFMYCNAVQEGSDLALVSMIVSHGQVVTFQFAIWFRLSARVCSQSSWIQIRQTFRSNKPDSTTTPVKKELDGGNAIHCRFIS
jgi:hypothetical protein